MGSRRVLITGKRQLFGDCIKLAGMDEIRNFLFFWDKDKSLFISQYISDILMDAQMRICKELYIYLPCEPLSASP